MAGLDQWREDHNTKISTTEKFRSRQLWPPHIQENQRLNLFIGFLRYHRALAVLQITDTLINTNTTPFDKQHHRDIHTEYDNDTPSARPDLLLQKITNPTTPTSSVENSPQ